MNRESRRQKSEERLRLLEAEFVVSLTAALNECAAGCGGLFGLHDDIINAQPEPLRTKLQSSRAAQLLKMGEALSELRKQLGETADFAPYRKYLDYRAMRSANLPGEPALARRLLTKLGLDPQAD